MCKGQGTGKSVQSTASSRRLHEMALLFYGGCVVQAGRVGLVPPTCFLLRCTLHPFRFRPAGANVNTVKKQTECQYIMGIFLTSQTPWTGPGPWPRNSDPLILMGILTRETQGYAVLNSGSTMGSQGLEYSELYIKICTCVSFQILKAPNTKI